jgi:hypothetical protein
MHRQVPKRKTPRWQWRRRLLSISSIRALVYTRRRRLLWISSRRVWPLWRWLFVVKIYGRAQLAVVCDINPSKVDVALRVGATKVQQVVKPSVGRGVSGPSLTRLLGYLLVDTPCQSQWARALSHPLIFWTHLRETVNRPSLERSSPSITGKSLTPQHGGLYLRR